MAVLTPFSLQPQTGTGAAKELGRPMFTLELALKMKFGYFLTFGTRTSTPPSGKLTS